ncbi:uncharacterized protein NPIL_485011 [Nephila pilipes]|uniref:Uncharacterized protein n=1 Tax=Nephila pilipes TaxID=299642 RepID=A0A8X6U2A4_NEPPI|nr:uncharacterized protein NPIL_485011 [Nephila pilipes]
MACSRKLYSLQDIASAQVAANLCQDNDFKELALCLEKPTYGAFILDHFRSSITNDPKILPSFVSFQKRPIRDFYRFCDDNDKREVDQWDAAIDKQCLRLLEGVPRNLKGGVEAWMNRIALEYLSYGRRQELLFGVSRYFLMDVLTLDCWTTAGRLDEKKVAERLLEDERLTVLQRYRIACVSCLHVGILQLWCGLTQEEKRSILSNNTDSSEDGRHELISLWSLQMHELTLERNYQWPTAAKLVLRYGSRSAMMHCWKKLDERMQKKLVNYMALQSLQRWQSIQQKLRAHLELKKALVLNERTHLLSGRSFERFNLPSYYSELMCFFLSQMDEQQQLTFFKQAFRCSHSDFVLECFLDFPHQDDFMPTIRRLWGILPKDRFEKCLSSLAGKYCANHSWKSLESLEKELRYYDYRNLMQTLWEETPDEFKRYLFPNHDDDSNHPAISKGEVLVLQLFHKSPFEEKDEALVKQIFCYQSQEKRRAVMSSNVGENICVLLARIGQWSFMNSLLEECFPKEDVPSFKKQFIRSKCGRMFCLNKLYESGEKWVENLIDWSFDLDSEKTQYKCSLITTGWEFFLNFFTFALDSDFREVERIIKFCVPSAESIVSLKTILVKDLCSALIKRHRWEEMDAILAWNFSAKEEIEHFKKDLLSEEGFDLHYQTVFVMNLLNEAQRFYEWFGLTPEEIKKLKKDTLFSSDVVSNILNMRLASLRWCLTDTETVILFDKKIEEVLCDRLPFLDENKKKAKKALDTLVSELLYDFRKKEIEEKEGKGKKRSSVVEDGCSSVRKRFQGCSCNHDNPGFVTNLLPMMYLSNSGLGPGAH